MVAAFCYSQLLPKQSGLVSGSMHKCEKGYGRAMILFHSADLYISLLHNPAAGIQRGQNAVLYRQM